MFPRPGKTQDEVLSAEPDMVLPGPEGGSYQEPACKVPVPGARNLACWLSPSAGFSHQDQFIFGTDLAALNSIR